MWNSLRTRKCHLQLFPELQCFCDLDFLMRIFSIHIKPLLISFHQHPVKVLLIFFYILSSCAACLIAHLAGLPQACHVLVSCEWLVPIHSHPATHAHVSYFSYAFRKGCWAEAWRCTQGPRKLIGCLEGSQPSLLLLFISLVCPSVPLSDIDILSNISASVTLGEERLLMAGKDFRECSVWVFFWLSGVPL